MTRRPVLAAPFPYFGGKSRVAPEIWSRLGDVARYVEPFAGSLAVLLARPRPFRGREIVNDVDGLLVNVWRALAHDPEAVAHWCDWPATESDLHARHAWLVGRRERLTACLEGDPDWYDAQAAGWWLWGIGLWIGGGWCSGRGPWRVAEGRLQRAAGTGGVPRQLLALGDDGGGVQRRLLAVGDEGRGVSRRSVATYGLRPRGVRAGARGAALLAAFEPLAERLREVVVMAGDWSRVVTPGVLFGTSAGRAGSEGACAVYLDPPYGEEAGRADGLYAADSLTVAHAVRAWAIDHGDDPRLRIALSGYAGEGAMPPTWGELAWKAHGGMGSQAQGVARANSRRERVWFSPSCLRAGLWDEVAL